MVLFEKPQFSLLLNNILSNRWLVVNQSIVGVGVGVFWCACGGWRGCGGVDGARVACPVCIFFFSHSFFVFSFLA